jgi:7,8-dihydroneopterin aldolase/epimerase/oxygenase
VDKIFLRDLRIETIVGIYEWERGATQVVSIDLEMDTDVRRAARNDSIEDTLNYKGVAKRLIKVVGESRFRLVETLAEAIARTIITEFPVPRVRVAVAKPGAIEGSREVGVAIERTRDDYA